MAAHGIVGVRFRRGRLPGMGPEADAESSTLRFARARTPRLLCDTQLPTRPAFGKGSAAVAVTPWSASKLQARTARKGHRSSA